MKIDIVGVAIVALLEVLIYKGGYNKGFKAGFNKGKQNIIVRFV